MKTMQSVIAAALALGLTACALNEVPTETGTPELAEAASPGPGQRMPSGRDIGVRSAVIAPSAAAATAHPLATQIALDTMKDGGSAMDAAIAANAMLGLVEPTANGIGGDLFAIVWDPKTRQLYGYNGSGRSAMGASLAGMQAKADQYMDGKEIPPFGSAPVTVPGTVDGWYALHARFGKRDMAENLRPAIEYARNGAPIPEVIAFYWSFGPKRFAPAHESGMLEEYANAKKTYFSPMPEEGSLFRNPDLANTLTTIAFGGRDAFYKGSIARTMDAYFKRIGGDLRYEDFAAHRGEWVEPLCVTYRDEVKLCELPPNSQGVAALQMLQMLEQFDLRAMGYGSADSLMAQIEAKRLAFADRAAGYADPNFSKINPELLITDHYAMMQGGLIDLTEAIDNPMKFSILRARETLIDDTNDEEEEGFRIGAFMILDPEKGWVRQAIPEPSAEEMERYREEADKWIQERKNADAKLNDGDTTYLTVTDKDGMMVSLIQSNYRGMGSGLVADGLGFMFQDRGQLFSLDPNHPNVFAPGKRPFHTIIPAFAFKKDMPSCQTRAIAPELACPYEPWLSFGLMGGGMQPQGHVQIILNLVDFDMGLQEAGDAARWEHRGGCEPTNDLEGDACESDIGKVYFESGIPPAARAELEARGHTIVCCQAKGGGYQAIMRDFNTGAWIAATEMRKDGNADGY